MPSGIPSGFRYEELLPHLFPGFFAAIASFMLIDVMSPFDFTSWAVKSIGGLTGFVGFIVLFGVILGVILDSIHHLILEDAIFDNLREVKKINILIKELYPKEEQEHLTHRYFLKELGENGVVIEEYIAKGFYSYTEFFANTFSSLLSFTFIVPFYLFYVLKVSWISSMLVAFMSFIFAITCLYKSYDTYKKYLKNKYSVILGHLEPNYPKNLTTCDNKKECLWASILLKFLSVGIIGSFLWAELTINISDQSFLKFLGIAILIIFASYLYVIKSGIIGSYIFNWDEIPGKDDDVLKRHLIRNYSVDWVRASKFRKSMDNNTIDISKGQNHIQLWHEGIEKHCQVTGPTNNKQIHDDILDVRKEFFNINIYSGNKKSTKTLLIIEFTLFLTLMVMFFILLGILSYFTPPHIIIEPKNFEEELTSGNRSIILSIQNIGANLTGVSLNIEGINDWLSLNSLYFPTLNNSEVKYVQVNMVIPQNVTGGEYRGAIIINATIYGKNIIEQHIAELIPEAIPEFKYIIKIK